MMQSVLVQELVRKLTALVESSTNLPSMTQLCEQWQVSYRTLAKAVAILTGRGMVECHRGRRLRAVRQKADLCRPASEESFLRRLRESILDGALRSGQALPKLQFYAATEHVSKHTVVKVIRRLESEALVHKTGRQWVVGPQKRPAAQRTSQDPPAVVMLVPYLGNLRELYESEFNARFLIPFTDELTRAGVREHYVEMYTADSDPRIRDGAFRMAEALLGTLGDRYLGAIVHRGPYRFDEHAQSMDSWVRFLVQRGKPAVFFDSNGNNTLYCRSRYPRSSQYYRFHLDEKAAIRRALEILVDAGHRRIGVPVPSEEPSEWPALRAKMVEAIASQMNPAPETFVIVQKEGIWHAPERSVRDTMYERIETKARTGNTPVSSHMSKRRTLLANTPSFQSLLSKQITAILAPNDHFAMTYHQWFSEAGIEIPRHLSLLSFDNISTATPFPISTIDFGFSRLGYLCAHVLLGDLPVKTGSDGNLAGECAHVDKGSVGLPRKGRVGL